MTLIVTHMTRTVFVAQQYLDFQETVHSVAVYKQITEVLLHM